MIWQMITPMVPMMKAAMTSRRLWLLEMRSWSYIMFSDEKAKEEV